jgi:hypothetical protein
MKYLAAALALALAACTPPASDDPMPTEPNAEGEAATTAPPEALASIEPHLPGFAVTSAASDNSTGAHGYRVTGTSGGQTYDVQLMLMTEGWRPVVIRRDVAWADAPQAVRTAAGAVTPQRVVEVREPGADGVVYELHTGGAEPVSVRFAEGQAALMPPAH